MATLSHEVRNWMPEYYAVLAAFASFLVGLRLLSRFMRVGGRFGVDDFFIVIAWLISIPAGVLSVIASQNYGLNRHIWDVPSYEWEDGAKLSWVVEVLFFFGTCFAKISILLFYRRLVAGTYSKAFKWIIWASIGFVILYTFIWFMLILTTCTPVEADWRSLNIDYMTKYKCAPYPLQKKLSLLGGVLSVITDVYSVLLPTSVLLNLNISARQKIGLICIFGAGFVVVGLGIVRTVYLVRVQSTAIDKSWNGFNVFVSGMAEFNIGIMCACAPSIQHYVNSFGHTVSSKVKSITGGSIGGKGQAKRASPGFTGSGASSVALEIMVEKGNGLDDGRKYPTEEHRVHGLSHASSRSPLTSAHRGSSPKAVRPGAMYDDDDTDLDGYEGRVGSEDWTNSSKLVV